MARAAPKKSQKTGSLPNFGHLGAGFQLIKDLGARELKEPKIKELGTKRAKNKRAESQKSQNLERDEKLPKELKTTSRSRS